MPRRSLLSFLLAPLVLPACAWDASTGPVDAAWARDLAAWRQDRTARLTAPDGWLTLVGLHWLEPGDHAFGADPANQVHIASAPAAHVGTFSVPNGSDAPVTFVASGAVPVTADGAPAVAVTLKDDRDGAPTVLTAGTVSVRVIVRDGRRALRIKDSASSVRTEFAGLRWFPDDASWRLTARCERDPTPLSIANVIGGVETMASPGTLVFTRGDRTFRLRALSETDDGGLFIVFGDPTNGRTTYGGGRFLVTAAPDASGEVEVDFNRAYSPPCAFTPYATCPLPPPSNRMAVEVEAGERHGGH